MRKWTVVAVVSALGLMGMSAAPRYLEALRIGGGYHAPVDGGTDLDAAGNVSADGTVAADGGIAAGREGAVRGVVTAWAGPGAAAPGCVRLGTANGTAGYVFLANDLAGLRVSGTAPGSDTDGAFTASGAFRGPGSTTNAVDLGTAEVAGTLPASAVGPGLSDAQVNDALTIAAGTINGSPIGASTPATGVFTQVTVHGAWVTPVVTFTANDTSPTVANAHLCAVATDWTPGHNVTAFDNGTAGQELVLIGGDSDCTVVDGAHLRLAGNWVANEACTLTLVFDGIDWLETGRSSN